MNELALFAGAGGGILGGLLCGFRTVCAVEIEPFCREVLLRRQLDGCLPKFPIWDDVRTFDGKPWRGVIDIVTGGFPCQDISCAGKGKGITGERSGLWSEMARIIGEIRPRFCLVENSPMLVSRGLDRVLSDFASMGYDARWGVIGADDAGMQHKRDRIWIIANRDKRVIRPLKLGETKASFRWNTKKRSEGWIYFLVDNDNKIPMFRWERGQTVNTKPIMRRNSDGLARGLDRIMAIGNGQVPAVVRLAWETLTRGLEINQQDRD